MQDWSKRAYRRTTAHVRAARRSPSVRSRDDAYRIAQEALTNVARHSRATKVEIILERRADHVLLVVEDDGAGFEPADETGQSAGFGLRGMHERAALVGASLEIESAAGKGTTILLRMATPAAGSAGNGA